MEIKQKLGIGLTVGFMLSLSLIILLSTRQAESTFLPLQISNLLRTRRFAYADPIENVSDTQPSAILKNDTDKLMFEPVLKSVHHAVHTEVNSHIGFENFMKTASLIVQNNKPEVAPKLPEIPEIEPTTTEPELDEFNTYNENNIVEMSALMSQGQPGTNSVLEENLPNFDICPIGPELPGESGSIRKVRNEERAKVDRRISGRTFIDINI
jgi:hypothetical protein